MSSIHISGGWIRGVPLLGSEKCIIFYCTYYSKDVNFTAFVDAIAKVNTSGFDHNSTYAFFMNVYNALAIKMIIDHPCVNPMIG